MQFLSNHANFWEFWVNSHFKICGISIQGNPQVFGLTLFQTGSGMTLSDGGGPLWPSLIFCYITQQIVALTPKTCSQIKFLIFRHPFTPLFQHSRESFPPFMSVNVDQHLDIETLKIRKTPKGPPFGNEKKFCLRFWWNLKHAILMA